MDQKHVTCDDVTPMRFAGSPARGWWSR